MFALERQDSRGADFELMTLWLAAAGLIAAWTFPLWRAFYPFACPLKSIAGIPCAFCGGTRSVHAWAQGQVLESWLLNPLAAVIAATATLYLPYALFCVVTRAERRLRLTALGPEASPATRWSVRLGLLLAVLANWIYLIAVGR